MTTTAVHSPARRPRAALILTACAVAPLLLAGAGPAAGGGSVGGVGPAVGGSLPAIASEATEATEAPPTRTALALEALLAAGPDTPASAPDVKLVATVAGVRPAVEDGRLVHPDGSCSSPVPLPDEFESACRAHDLGYALLRAADRAGEALPREARQRLDRRLGGELLAVCPPGRGPSDDWCGRTARVAYTAVRINSVRQGDGPPVEEWWAL